MLSKKTRARAAFLLVAVVVTCFGFTFSGVTLSGQVVVEEGPYVILPFGASNTGGQGTDDRRFAYRKSLQSTIGLANVELVGDFQNPPSDATYDVDHSGIGGQSTSQLEARLLTALQTYLSASATDQYVIIDHGLNDGGLDTDGERIAARDNLEDMIDIAYAFNPNLTIIVTTDGPVQTTETFPRAYDDVQNFHDNYVIPMLESKLASVPNLRICDTNEYRDTGADGQCGSDFDSCMYDAAHPTLTGYQYSGEFIASCVTSCGSNSLCQQN